MQAACTLLKGERQGHLLPSRSGWEQGGPAGAPLSGSSPASCCGPPAHRKSFNQERSMQLMTYSEAGISLGHLQTGLHSRRIGRVAC